MQMSQRERSVRVWIKGHGRAGSRDLAAEELCRSVGSRERRGQRAALGCWAGGAAEPMPSVAGFCGAADLSWGFSPLRAVEPVLCKASPAASASHAPARGRRSAWAQAVPKRAAQQ